MGTRENSRIAVREGVYRSCSGKIAVEKHFLKAVSLNIADGQEFAGRR